MSGWPAIISDCLASYDVFPPPDSFQDAADKISDDYANNPSMFSQLIYYPFPIGPAVPNNSTDSFVGAAMLSLTSPAVQNDINNGVLFTLEAPDLVNRRGNVWIIYMADIGNAPWPPEGYPI